MIRGNAVSDVVQHGRENPRVLRLSRLVNALEQIGDRLPGVSVRKMKIAQRTEKLGLGRLLLTPFHNRQGPVKE